MTGADSNHRYLRLRWIALLIPVTQIVYAPGASAMEADSGEAGESPACPETQVFQAGWTHTMELLSWDRIGSEKALLADVAVMPPADGDARFLVYFRKPDDIRAVRLLAKVAEDRNELFLYSPIFFKTRKITGRQLANSVHGTDFSYEDLEWLLGMLRHRQSPEVAQEDIDGRMYYRLVSTPERGQGSRYQRLVSYIDPDSCVLHRVDLYGHAERKLKVLTVDSGSIAEVNGVVLPHRYTMEDLAEGTRTQLTISDIRVDRALPQSAFSVEKIKDFRGFF